MQFLEHRNNIVEKMASKSILILQSATEKTRSNDTNYVYRQESNFYYATGFLEPNSIVVLIKSETSTKSILFVQAKDVAKELWEGEVLGVDAAKEQLGVDEVYDINTFESMFPPLLNLTTTLYHSVEEETFQFIQKSSAKAKNSKDNYAAIDCFKEASSLLFPLRRTKSAWEIEQIKKALAITKKAHHAAMALTNPSKGEHEVLAVVEYIFTKNGAKSDAYTTIAASGNAANTLHYIHNDKPCKEGTLLLLDAGVEHKLYASDITRTYPVNGTFSQAQKEVYSIVLAAQKAAFAVIKEGALRSDVNVAAVRVLTQGLIDLGIIVDATLDEAIEKEYYKIYYPHGIGHWMGLDVHDPLPYRDENAKELPLQKGDVLTIEPGLYLNENNSDIPSQYKGIGIRIEDDILVTKTGYENLSEGIAKEIEEVELACQQSIYDFI